MNEAAKPWLLKITQGCRLVAPVVLPYEVGNALSAWAKRKVLSPEQAIALWDKIVGMPVELVEFDMQAALLLSARQGIYAYDGYFLQSALEARCPLLTLDQGMKRIARKLGIEVVEQ